MNLDVLASGTQYLILLVLVVGPPVLNQCLNLGFSAAFFAKVSHNFSLPFSRVSMFIFSRADC